MNEIFDKLTLRFVFTVVLLLSVFLYRYLHSLFYPSMKSQLVKIFIPNKNESDTLHLFSRILGIGIIYSEFYFQMNDGFTFAIIDFLLRSLAAFVMYIGSIFIIESIVLYNFEYNDEILKRKNLSYAIICFAHSVGLAFILRNVLKVSMESFIFMLFLWLFSMTLIGFAVKTFEFIFKITFNPLLIQKSIPLGLSYTGFFIGWCLIISSAIDNELFNIKWYSIQVILKMLLSLIILPVILKGINYFFKLNDQHNTTNNDGSEAEVTEIDLGNAIYLSISFLTACFFTTVITGKIYFGSFYPIF